MPEANLIAFTQALIRRPSPSGQEGPVVELIVNEMRGLGYDRVWVDGNGSAVGVIEGAQSGSPLILDGHCDTVGIAPGVPWRHDPFAAEITDGAMYGRGAADMKSAIAAMVYAAASVDRSRIAGSIVVCATVMEENLEGAALKAVMDAVHPGFVVIGEATALKLARGGRGRAEIHLETTGRPAHSSTPHLGRNAVHDMLKVIAAVESIPLGRDSFMGPAVMALTDIISEPYPAYSVIPSRCRVTYDRRLLPGETAEEILDTILGLPGLGDIQLRATIAQGEHQTYTGACLQGPKFLPAWVLPEDDSFVRLALHGLHAAGLAAECSAYQFCTNAAYSAGTAGVPTVGFGPGKEEDAHVIDERVSIEELLAAERGYRGIIKAVLGTDKHS